MKALLEVTKQLQLDIQHEADVVEAMLGQFLLSVQPGIYGPMDIEPRVALGNTYYINSMEWTPNDVSQLEEYLKRPFGDIYTASGDVCVYRAAAVNFTLMPRVSVRGITIIIDMISEMIRANSHWDMGKWAVRAHRSVLTYSPYFLSVAEMLKSHLRPEYKESTGLLYDLTEGLIAIFSEKSLEISRFLGDDRWIMHFVESNGTDVLIKKSIDFRIAQWQEEHGHKYFRG